ALEFEDALVEGRGVGLGDLDQLEGRRSPPGRGRQALHQAEEARAAGELPEVGQLRYIYFEYI
ncbi:hypothetical protein AAIH15_35240, partial [Pseudomonas aeruginosa]